VIASAGNSGPNPSTILIPACDPEVIAVGGIYSDKFEVWEGSSRGPTKEGNICPDFVCWSTDIHCADSESDSAYKLKSGTSFSCPIICGVGGLIWELGRRTFGEPWLFSWYDARNLGEAICIKPENYPIHKDNAMGFGLPALNVMVREAMGGAAPEVSLINQLLPLLIIIPMLRMVM
jgi:serine protease AprX